MKLKIEIDSSLPEEVILRAPEINDTVRRVRQALDGALQLTGEIAVRCGGEELFLPYSAIYFFEVENDRVYANTANDAFICNLRLAELAELLPRAFARASKSCIVNTAKIRSLKRSPTGVCETGFSDSEKKIYISRMYYRAVRDIIEETRLSK